MGSLADHLQKQIYIEQDLWPLVVVLAQKLKQPTYKVINRAIRDAIEANLTDDDRSALSTIFRGNSNGPTTDTKPGPTGDTNAGAEGGKSTVPKARSKSNRAARSAKPKAKGKGPGR